MELAGDAFFLSYLSSLTNNQLSRLIDWQDERISADPTSLDDAVSKKRLIWAEQRRRK
ncbi:hypothetical protein LCGC14_0344500 [marine sediment metagenome]|uniref:Uncharacterized protein n=1 Tax=marine sediment metagenome TaxID=412755 RepID=A0A0F9TIB1_9ZZZZ